MAMVICSMDLTKKHCVPCQSGDKPLTPDKVAIYLTYLTSSWKNVDDRKITRDFKFAGFPEAVAFVDKIVPLAEEEGHHPNLHIYYDTVTVELWTHKIGGLSENDFILARKIEELL